MVDRERNERTGCGCGNGRMTRDFSRSYGSTGNNRMGNTRTGSTREGNTRSGNTCGCENAREGNTRSGNSCGCENTREGNTRTGGSNRLGGTGRTADSTCSARSCGETDCCDKMEELRKLEFAIVDVALYLNAYPDSECALAYYHRLIEERSCLLRTIREECGPITLFDNESETCWKWTDGPWPWHYGGN